LKAEGTTTKGKKTAAGVAGRVSSTDRQMLAAKLLMELPGSTLSWKFGNASLQVGESVFAFTRKDGSVAMKLPEARVIELSEAGVTQPLVMGRRTMREWAVVPDAGSRTTLELMREAMEFVERLPVTKRVKASAKSRSKIAGQGNRVIQ
jgi:hypothetical protein